METGKMKRAITAYLLLLAVIILLNTRIALATVNDVAVTNVSPSKTVVGQGFSLNVNVTVENQGDFPETFNVTLQASRLDIGVVNINLYGSAFQGWGFTMGSISSPGPIITVNQGDLVNLTLTSADGFTHNFFVDYNGDTVPSSGEPESPNFSTVVNYSFKADVLGTYMYYCQFHKFVMFGTFVVQTPPTVTTQIGKQQVALSNGNSAVLAFVWNTMGFIKGNYTLSAIADTVAGETDTADNTFVDGWVIIAMVGDLTGPSGFPDGKVDIRDVAAVAKLFGVIYPNPQYVSNYDVNNDGKIDIKDVATVAKNFGQIDP